MKRYVRMEILFLKEITEEEQEIITADIGTPGVIEHVLDGVPNDYEVQFVYEFEPHQMHAGTSAVH